MRLEIDLQSIMSASLDAETARMQTPKVSIVRAPSDALITIEFGPKARDYLNSTLTSSWRSPMKFSLRRIESGWMFHSQVGLPCAARPTLP
jgi:hypothetical protein